MKFFRRFLAVVAASFLSAGVCAATAQLNETLSSAANTAPDSSSGQTAPGPPAILAEPRNTIDIPGPLRSFLRMAGISQEATPREVLPLLARSVFLHGHNGSKETEYLLLIDRYVSLSRELEALAGSDGAIRVADCAQAAKLIAVLGFKFERGCGRKGADLITENSERAFLTVDSGFPLTALEEALQKGTPFSYPFPATPVPVLFTEKDWVAASPKKMQPGESLLDVLLHDVDVDRLYSAMARSDLQTRLALYRSPGLRKLLPVAAAFDFYGSNIRIRSGAVVLPTAAAAAKDWEDLAGASPQASGEFVVRLMGRDHGALAAYFDAFTRVSRAQQSHWMEGDRLKRLYDAFRSSSLSSGPAIGVFARNASVLQLLSSLRWDESGNPMVPGDLGVWQELLNRGAKSSKEFGWGRRVLNLQTPNQLLEELVTVSNDATDNAPDQAYLALCAIDGARAPAARMSAATAGLLVANFHQMSQWYLIFSEFPALDDAAITAFVNTANQLSAISDPGLRPNALGAFQAEIGIWQILARQNEIPPDRLNAAWQDAIKPYAGISSSLQLFDAARNSLKSIVSAAAQSEDISQDRSQDRIQDRIVDLLAGPSSSQLADQRVHHALSDRMRTVMEDQRLVSLDTLFGLDDGLASLAKGNHVGDALLPLAGELREFELPRPIFTGGEKASWSPIIYTSRHAELQVKTDLTKMIRTPGTAAQMEAARGRLTPFLRDTLVGLNYAYYEPPGAEVLHNNPLFVRSHDFTIASVEGVQPIWGPPTSIGVGVTAGGGAYLMGSLAGLPYALAETEEDFIAPEKVQALIWKEAVPELLVGAILPRWWGISRNELHAAGLYQRAGEELLLASTHDAPLRGRALNILSACIPQAKLDEIDAALQSPQSATAAVAQIEPAATFYLESEFRRNFPQQAPLLGPDNRELDDLARNDPAATSPARLSRDFGAPHPTLANTNSLSIGNMEPYPAASGNSSRLFAESWDSSNLYWARLADELGYSPAALNLLAPGLTNHMIANLFATSLDDWPALVRAMEETGTEFRQGKFSIPAAASIAEGERPANGSVRGNE